MKPYKKVFVAGAFDNFHVGHQYLLWSASRLAEEMVVIVATDVMIEKLKPKKAHNNEKKRFARIEKEGMQNTTIRMGRSDGNFWKTLEEESPDLLYLGYDQKFNEKECWTRFPNMKIERCIEYFPQFFKSSKF